MITLRQTIITGWLLVLLSVIGAVIGFVLYSKLVIGEIGRASCRERV